MITLNGEDFEIIIQETPDYDNDVSVVLGTPEHVFESGINYLYLVVVIYVQIIMKLNEFKCVEMCSLWFVC